MSRCFGGDTILKVFPNIIKSVKEINLGDKLIGNDFNIRKIEHIYISYGPTFKIKQKEGNEYILSGDQILCLVWAHCTESFTFQNQIYNYGDKVEILVFEYQNLSKNSKQYLLGYSVLNDKIFMDGLWTLIECTSFKIGCIYGFGFESDPYVQLSDGTIVYGKL